MSSEESLNMPTNEAVVAALQRDVEDEVQALVRRLVELDEREAARLQVLEREVLHAVFRLGRRWLARVWGAHLIANNQFIHTVSTWFHLKLGVRRSRRPPDAPTGQASPCRLLTPGF
jgi:hypothetical protein